jgi:hypothetical protein
MLSSIWSQPRLPPFNRIHPEDHDTPAWLTPSSVRWIAGVNAATPSLVGGQSWPRHRADGAIHGSEQDAARICEHDGVKPSDDGRLDSEAVGVDSVAEFGDASLASIRSAAGIGRNLDI